MCRNRSPKQAVLFLVVLSLGIVLLLPERVFAGEDCVKMERWLKEHQETLPRDYEGISHYPLSYRRAIFGVLSPEEKSEAWRTHLNLYLETHPDLTADQRDVLFRALDLLSPEFYSLPKRDLLWHELFGMPLLELEGRAKQVFDAESRKAIFAELGGAKPRLMLSPVLVDKCECSTISDWCDSFGPESETCKVSTCTVNGGCGTGWGYTCDGECENNSQTN